MEFDFGSVWLESLSPDFKGTPGGPGSTAREYYDAGVKRWLSRIFAVNGKTVPMVMAAPMNAFAAYDKLLTDSGRNPCGKTDITTWPLPMVSVSALAPRDRPGHCAAPIRNVNYVDGPRDRPSGNRVDKKYGVTYTRYPKPVYYPYSIDIWCLYINHLTWLNQRMEEAFSASMSHFRVETPFLAPEEGIIAGAKKISVTDNSSLERDISERLLRYTWNIDVEAWVFFDLLQAPTVHALTRVDDSNPNSIPAIEDTIDLTGDAKVPIALQTGPLEPSTDGVDDAV